MPKKKSIFSMEREETVTVSTKVPASLKTRADHINQKLEDLAPGKTFNVSQILSDAYKSAVEMAEKEIRTLTQNTGSKPFVEKPSELPVEPAHEPG